MGAIHRNERDVYAKFIEKSPHFFVIAFVYQRGNEGFLAFFIHFSEQKSGKNFWKI